MANEEPEVKDVETVHIEPARDDEELVKPEEGQEEVKNEEKETPESSSDEKKPEEEAPEPETGEEIPQRQVAQVEKKEPKPVDGETPREYALRKEVERLKGKVRDTRAKEIFDAPPAEERKPIAQGSKKEEVLKRYDVEELAQFKELLEAAAEDLGYAKKDEYQKSNYQSTADEVLNTFLDSHPEYSPENDKGDLLWNRFKEELSIYKTPQNPKDYRKMFDRIHKDIFNIQSDATSLNKIKASQEKIKVASHSSASSNKTPTRSKEPLLDPSLKAHLKGFDDKELNDIFEG